MKGFVHIGAGFLSLALCFTLASGQTTTTPTTTTTTTTGGPTCPTVPTSLTAFSTESTVTVSDVLAATAPNIPANILASITGGAQEIREQVNYNPEPNEVTVTFFTVAPGSPIPTTNGTTISQSTLAQFTLSINTILQSCTPSPSILFVGTVISSTGGPGIPAGALGSLVGAPVAISVGYTNANPPVLSNAVVLLAGVAVSYAASSTGTVTFPAAPVTPPGSSGGPTIVLNPPYPNTGGFGLNQVTQNPIAIDASKTVGAMTYSWTASPPVAFAPSSANAAVEQIDFPGPGTYTITLTVTGSSGSSTYAFPLTFVGR